MPANPETAQLLADSLMLAELMRAQGWDTFLKTMDAIEREQNETLIRGGDVGITLEYLRGYIMGLRRAKALPQEIVRNAARARTMTS